MTVSDSCCGQGWSGLPERELRCEEPSALSSTAPVATPELSEGERRRA